jgi:putative ABC transport system ATP-binding protein
MPDGSDTPRLEARLMRVEFSGRVVLDAVNFAVSAGEIAVLQGPSGSGKSTFLRALATLEPFAAGSLWLEGREVPAGDFATTRVKVAYVPQFPVMFVGSVAENVRTGPRLRGAVLSDAEVAELLRRVSLDPAFGSRVARDLSGGEKQRVAIARALANAPKVILLDEPTSALDPASTDGILSLIRSCAAEGLAVVVVTHLLEQAARLGGTHYVCDQGRIQKASL